MDSLAAKVPKGAVLDRIKQVSELPFFNQNIADPGAWQIIAWWEARRIPYNLLVGVTGVVSGSLCLITGLLCEHFTGEPIGIPDPPAFALLAVIAYGVMANICYTGGWIAELIVQKMWPEKEKSFGKISFFLGVIFSVLLTLAPGILVSVIGSLNLLGYFLNKLFS